jgi:hypothetical protein
MIAKTGQPEEDCPDRIAETGLPKKDSQDKTTKTRTGKPLRTGQSGWIGTGARIGQPGQDSQKQETQKRTGLSSPSLSLPHIPHIYPTIIPLPNSIPYFYPGLRSRNYFMPLRLRLSKSFGSGAETGSGYTFIIVRILTFLVGTGS